MLVCVCKEFSQGINNQIISLPIYIISLIISNVLLEIYIVSLVVHIISLKLYIILLAFYFIVLVGEAGNTENAKILGEISN